MASMADINKVFNINTYLPVILVVHCAMVALGIWERLFNMCVSEKFRFSTDDIDDEYTEKVGELIMRLGTLDGLLNMCASSKSWSSMNSVDDGYTGKGSTGVVCNLVGDRESNRATGAAGLPAGA